MRNIYPPPRLLCRNFGLDIAMPQRTMITDCINYFRRTALLRSEEYGLGCQWFATPRSSGAMEASKPDTESLLIRRKAFMRAAKRSHLHWEYASRGRFGTPDNPKVAYEHRQAR
jgi:hypothetical protein